MKLLRFSYEASDNQQIAMNALKTDLIELNNINLLVGKNASGKSTLVQEIFGLVLIIKDSELRLGKFYIELELDDKRILKYTCEVTLKGDIEISEKLLIGEEILLSRNGLEGRLFSKHANRDIEINPPKDRLTLHVRRDEKEFPFLEYLVRWAESVHSFKFGHVHSTSFVKSNSSIIYPPYLDITSIQDTELNKMLGELNNDSKEVIRKEFNCLGYNLEVLGIGKGNRDQNIIMVKEHGVRLYINQYQLSQGMFRSLFLLIFIHHLIEKEKAQMIIIDDLCEGLDFDRSTRLGRLLFDKMEKSNIQFIATSNDSFLMNVVDVKYWNIIEREGMEIKVRNYSNSKEKFDDFRLSGFNNFDLLSSNFLD